MIAGHIADLAHMPDRSVGYVLSKDHVPPNEVVNHVNHHFRSVFRIWHYDFH